MRPFLAAAIALLISGVACGQFKGSTTAPPKVQVSTPATESLDDARRIPRDEAIKLVKEKKAVWVDVRTKDQYDLGHIKGALNVPLPDLANRFRDLPVKKFLITYCA
jgi:3-mercaptopyruvate sulfurtransferase SseA